jgi:N-glycosylase/DNA lyase
MILKLPWKAFTHVAKESTKATHLTESTLNLRYSLLNGQSFNWYSIPDSIKQEDGIKEEEKSTTGKPQKTPMIYQGVFKKHFIQFKAAEDGTINYRAYPEDEKLPIVLADYFQLSYDYPELIKEWKESDPYFAKMFTNVSGIRILRQDPFECLIGFICSQNNNIPRITKLIYSLCEKYGNLIDEIEGKKYYTFPRLHELIKTDEQTLRDMGFGYRAKYLASTLKSIEEKGGEKWLLSLRGKDHKVIQEELTSLMGIGKKVADCVSLFSLDCFDIVPVDTHVHNLYLNVYKKGDKNKGSLSDQKYREIGEFFRKKFGTYAGWAHSYLFTTELNEFKEIKAGSNIEETKTGKKKVANTKKVTTTEVVVKIKKTEDTVVKTETVTVKTTQTKKRKTDEMTPTLDAKTGAPVDGLVADGIAHRVKRVRRNN